MKNKIILACVLALSLSAFTASADTSTAVKTAPALPSLVQKIADAKQMLSAVNLNYALNPVYKNVATGKGKTKKTTRTLTGYTLTAKDIALAILDPATNEIKITAAMQKGKTFTFPDKDFSIEAVSFNGVNTRFSVSKPTGGKVLALKYLITGPESGSKTAIESALQPVIYVPYSPELQIPEVSAYGQQYLDRALAQATAQLQNIPSASKPGSFVTEAVQPNILKALLYAEHVDTSEFQRTKNIQTLIDKVNVLYAGNQEDTFKYSVSSAGARGIAQFVSGTYNTLAARHPEAGLNPDFVAGMNDHVNAIKAEYLLIDDYIADVEAKTGADYNPAYAYDYGAAAYNGGTTRVARAVKTYGTNWYENQSDNLAQIKSNISAQTAELNKLKAQLKKAKTKSGTNSLNNQIKNETNVLADLKAQYDNFDSAALRTETVYYLEKMHKLIPIFNAELQIASIQ